MEYRQGIEFADVRTVIKVLNKRIAYHKKNYPDATDEIDRMETALEALKDLVRIERRNNMNELWIDVGNGYIYYATNATNLNDALVEFETKMRQIGCNVDNFAWNEIELRDEDCNPFEYIGDGFLRNFV